MTAAAAIASSHCVLFAEKIRGFRNNCKEPWQLRQKQLEKLEPKSFEPMGKKKPQKL